MRALALALLLCGCGASGDAVAGEATEVRALSAGGRRTFASFGHTCASVGAQVQCWGAGESGQLGDGRYSLRRPLPVRVRGLTGAGSDRADRGFSLLAAGGAHTCAVRGSEVHCWGDNRHSQGGVAEPALLLEPARVSGLPGPPTALAAGAEHTCAVAGGEVWCWGRSEAGALGFDPREPCRAPHRELPCRAPPARVGGLPGEVSALALGARHSCALVEGRPWCWGANGRGQLGDAGGPGGGTPRPVSGLPGSATALVAGARHACALVEGRAWCWGANDRGQLGDGTRNDRKRPVAVGGLPARVTRLAAGGDRSCAALAGGVRCWGARRGEGTDVPVRVSGLRGEVSALAVGWDHACAALADAGVYCWGDNDYGQLGSGDAPRDHVGAVAVGAWDDGRIRDRDGDGRIALVCLGDSNTWRVEGAPTPWCERLAALLPPHWSVRNRGLGGAMAVSGVTLLRAEAQLAYVLENDAPDVVILAYGTNDLLARVETPRIVRAYQRHEQRALEAGATVFVALTPPLRPPGHAANRSIRALNVALRETFPDERIVDFFSGMEPDDFIDDVHLGDSGQAKRARAAAGALADAGAPPEGALRSADPAGGSTSGRP